MALCTLCIRQAAVKQCRMGLQHRCPSAGCRTPGPSAVRFRLDLPRGTLSSDIPIPHCTGPPDEGGLKGSTLSPLSSLLASRSQM